MPVLSLKKQLQLKKAQKIHRLLSVKDTYFTSEKNPQQPQTDTIKI